MIFYSCESYSSSSAFWKLPLVSRQAVSVFSTQPSICWCLYFDRTLGREWSGYWQGKTVYMLHLILEDAERSASRGVTGPVTKWNIVRLLIAMQSDFRCIFSASQIFLMWELLLLAEMQLHAQVIERVISMQPLRELIRLDKCVSTFWSAFFQLQKYITEHVDSLHVLPAISRLCLAALLSLVSWLNFLFFFF